MLVEHLKTARRVAYRTLFTQLFTFETPNLFVGRLFMICRRKIFIRLFAVVVSLR